MIREIETSDAVNMGIKKIMNLKMRPDPSKIEKWSERNKEINPRPLNEVEECPEGKLRLPSATRLNSPLHILLLLESGSHLDKKSGLNRPTGDYENKFKGL